MSLFGGGKEVSVSTVVYNLAGPEEHRPDYLKSLVVRNILSGTKDSIPQTLNNGYLNGPAMKFRSFYRWAKKGKNYGQIGIPRAQLDSGGALEPTLIEPAIPREPYESVWVQQAELDRASYLYWAEQWIMLNRPDELENAWSADFKESTQEITINFEDGSKTKFIPSGFNFKSRYIYAYYNLVSSGIEGPVVTGPEILLGPEELPSTEGWTLVPESGYLVPVSLTLTTTEQVVTTRSYADGRPDEVITDPPTVLDETTGVYENSLEVYRRETYLGGETDLMTRIETLYLTQTASKSLASVVVSEVSEEEIEGVMVTTTVQTTTDTETVNIARTSRTDTQEITSQSMGPLRLYIYRIGGSNPDLNKLVRKVKDYGEFYPSIPFRLEGNFLSENYHAGPYKQASKAYKKATGSSLDKLIDKVSDNEDLEDIDHAYVVFGVSLNVVENSCKKYLYRFFEKLQANQSGGANSYAEWKQAQEGKLGDSDTWEAWKQAQNDGGNPLYGTPEPKRPDFSTLPTNVIQITNAGGIMDNYDIHLNWTFIASGSGRGKGKRGAKRGHFWFEKRGTDEIIQKVQGSNSVFSGAKSFEKIRLYWQRDADHYTYLDITGLTHTNYIYGGKAVSITSHEALDDPDESGFIVPLHNETFRETSLVDASQMGTACVFVVFNCYVVRKQKWYESGVFRILLVIVIAIVSVLLTGGAGIGILGAHMAVGAAFGLTGMTAAIVGSVVNALAAMILVSFIEKLAVGLFGEMIGGIIASLFMMVVGNIAGGLTSGTFAFDWSNLLRVDNLLSLTNSVAGAYANQLNADTMAIGEEMKDYAKKSAEEANKIQQAFFDEFGYGAGQIDPLMFVNGANRIMAESSDTFLTRTLMTGSEIAEMSRDLLYNFSEYTLKLPDAFT